MATGGEKARAKPFSAMAASSSSLRPTASAVRAISSVSVVPVTVRSSVEMVTLTPARWSAAIGWLAWSGTIPAWTLEVGQRSRVTSRARRSWRSAVVLDGGHPVGHAADPEVEHLADPLRARDLSRVGGQREPAVPRLVEGGGVWGRRPLHLGTGKVEARRSAVRTPPPLRASSTFAAGGCERIAVTIRPISGAALPCVGDCSRDPGRDRLEDRGHRQTALEVQAWRPANLRVPDAVVREVLDELAGDTLERVTGLEQRDREVEVLEQLRLARAVLGRDHAAACFVEIERHADRSGQLDGRLRADRPVQMLVELRLRERAQRIGRDHPPMIGTRAAASAGIAVLGLAIVLGPFAAEPSVAIAAEHLVRERATAAVSAIDALRAAIQPGLEAARHAAADVVNGDETAGHPDSSEAAALIAGAEESIVPARHAVAELDSARVAWHPDAPVTPQLVSAGELASIAAQLAAAGPAADEFADLSARATGLPGVLEEAFVALERGDVERATELTARARADHGAVVAWETDLPTLPVWIETTDAMIGAVERILEATRAGDAAAAGDAADEFVALADEAATADRALRIALSEGGAALTAAPLGRLAAALDSIEGARAAAAAAASDLGG